tara:strand:- start:517 stop:696 length:180 start_codon:yes stop_codon:yes gene_type:complete
MIDYGLKQWATKFRASKLYLRALGRKKHQNPPQYNNNLGAYKLDQKILQASRFTPYFNN